MMGNGTKSAPHGRTALDHGRCIKMERWQLLEEVLRQVCLPSVTNVALHD